MDVTATASRRCPGCGATLHAGDRFCEQCGARAEADADRASAVSDRMEIDLGPAAAVSDRGRVHRRNEDAFRVEVTGDRRAIAVVCDGISSASAADAAARGAAAAAASVLIEAASDATRDGAAAVLEATAAANAAVAEVPCTTRADRGLPSCTLVCALQRPGEIVIASVGDSRAYWIDSAGARQLTVDDSWAEEQISAGRLSAAEATRDPRSHSITRWIGADAPARPARVVRLNPVLPGRLLLCSDGLWNYLAASSALRELIEGLPAEASAVAVARALTDVALHRGGRDNITVAVIDVS